MASKDEFYKELYYESSDEGSVARSMKSSKVKLRRGKQVITKSRVGHTEHKDNPQAEPKVLRLDQLPRITQQTSGEIFDPTDDRADSRSASALRESRSRSSWSPQINPFQVVAMPKPKRPTLKEAPEALQLFRGRTFFFLPDNNVAQGRRLRIEKAQQYGAVWAKQWSSDISHIIVDKGIKYEDIIKYLKIPTIPNHVILVNELYPPHCITYNHMVNPKQPQYQVQGYVAALKAAAEAVETQKEMLGVTEPDHSSIEPPSTVSSASLQVKSTKQSVEKTPSRYGYSAESAASREARLLGEEKGTLKPYQPSHKPDALDDAIGEAQGLESLPIDISEAEPEDNVHVSDTEDENKTPKLKRRRISSQPLQWEKNFSCMTKSDGTSKNENPNKDTIETLQKMYEYYERMQDHWRTWAYRKAISALKRQTVKISTKEQAIAIPFIGERLADKIEEVVWTGRLRRLVSTELEPNDEALQAFVKIYGVGYKQAAAFVAKGYRSLVDLKTKASLTTNQKIGIEHYEDFHTRIPRDEIGRHARLVREVLQKINPDIDVQVGGSYRRGAVTSGDIDYIVTAKNMPMSVLRTQVLGELMPRLWAIRYLKCCLAETSVVDGTKWHGAAVLPGSNPPIWRRIDFLLVPYEEYGAALIYFTGNDIFNRSIRLLASKKGMRLNHRGLWKDVIRGPERSRLTQGTLVESRSEKAIFTALGVPWRPPEHRNC